MEKMNQNHVVDSSGNKLKIIIVILILFLLGSAFYIYKMGVETKTAQNNELKVVTEKSILLANLEKQKIDYDMAIKDKTAISEDLETERSKVIELIAEVKKSKGDIQNLAPFKKKYLALESKMKTLMVQNAELKKVNINLTNQRDSTVSVLGEAKKNNNNLMNKNSELTDAVVKASELSIVGLKAIALKAKGSGKQLETEKARATDLIKINYSIAKNLIAKAGEKFYYIQVIDANNNVIGDKQTQNFESKVLTYSIKSKVNFQNETINISEELFSKDFVKGTYIVNLFQEDNLIANTSFTLK